MAEQNNNFEQKDLQVNSQEKIEQAKKNVTWRVVEALNTSGDEIVEAKKGDEILGFSSELSELKENIAPKAEKSAQKVSINWEAYNTSHNHKKIEQSLANTSTAEFLRGVHEELRARKIGEQYLHLMEDIS